MKQNNNYTRPIGSPKRKTLAYDILTVTYDYETDVMTVKDADVEQPMQFSKQALEELQSALRSLGRETGSNPNEVHIR